MDVGSNGEQIQVLAGAAAHLTSALDVLSINGCHWLTEDLAEILDAIDGHIAVLQELSDGGASSGFGA